MMKRFPLHSGSLSILRHYAKLNNGSLISLKLSFVVPQHPSWPEQYHGYRLGYLVNRLRSQGQDYYATKYPQLYKELDSIGFVWNAISMRRAAIVSGFATYRSLYGNLDIKRSFVVPNNDPQWPLITWNMKLGLIARNMRNYDSNDEIRKIIEKLGFDYNFQKKPMDFDDVFESLLAFKRLHGNLLIPETFVIAPLDVNYPVSMRGHNLGRLVAHIRRYKYYQHEIERLNAIGFQYCTKAEMKFNFIYNVLQCYQKKYGHVYVKADYVISKNDDDFPIGARGMKLGKLIRSIGAAKGYQPYLHRLKELGIELKRRGVPVENEIADQDHDRIKDIKIENESSIEVVKDM